ncbi:MAG: histidine kinase [Thermoanaerobaculia bacterium]
MDRRIVFALLPLQTAMATLFSPRSRAERLIAGGRVVLAASSLFAVWRDPSEPAKYVSTAYALLVAYLVYAVLVAVTVWRTRAPPRLQGWLTHTFDLIFFSAFMYFTSGPASPFIAYYVFALVCATLRWQWKGTLWTAIASLAAFLGLGFYFAEVLHDPTFELNQFIIRGFYMGVVALLLGYVGVHEQRTRQEISFLAGWPQGVPQAMPQAMPQSAERWIEEQLRYLAKTLGAPGVLLAWERNDRPPLSVAAIRDSRFTLRERPDRSLRTLVAPELADCSLLLAGAANPVRGGDVLIRDSAGFRRWRGEALDPELAIELAATSILSLPIRSELLSGRLFALDKSDMTSDDLLLGEVCATLIGGRLDHLVLMERFKDAAATEERIRLARDLHDGVLQSFTGFGLRVAAIRRLASERPLEAETRLLELQRLVAVEQRDLRFLIQELEPGSGANEESFPLENRLAELLARVEQEWQLEVRLETSQLSEDLSDDAAHDVYHIVREGLVNAVRHGDATRVEIQLSGADAGRLALSIVDNGHGFPFQGRFGHEELARMQAGPRTLRERVVARGGSLVLETGPEGARLDIAVPV